MIPQLLELAQRTPDAPLVIHEDTQYTFAQMGDLALRGANWLDCHDIQRGDHVVLAVGNRPLFLFYWFALLARGAVAVPISPDAFGESLAYIVEQSDAKAICVEACEARRFRETLGLDHCVLFTFETETDYIDALAGLTPAVPASMRPDEPASILYTSGTTGEPKGAVIPIGSYLAAGREVAEGVGITAEDRILVCLPLHHANPQMYAVMSMLTTGCCLVLVARFSASSLLAQAERHSATGFTYVGTVLSILSKTIEAPRSTNLRWCVGGGAPDPVWRDIVAKLGLRIHELYGMTETGGITTMNTQDAMRVGTVGRARHDFEVALVDDDDRLVEHGVGEIVVRPRTADTIMKGYYCKPDETLAAITNLWFHTGDFGRFDEEGYLVFEGRKKELIRRAGEMISPVAIEAVANRHPDVADCAAIGVPDAIVDEEIKLVIVTRDPFDVGSLLEHLRSVLPRHAVPRYLDFVDAIPKTPTEKIQRFKLTESTDRLLDVQFDPADLSVEGQPERDGHRLEPGRTNVP